MDGGDSGHANLVLIIHNLREKKLRKLETKPHRSTNLLAELAVRDVIMRIRVNIMRSIELINSFATVL